MHYLLCLFQKQPRRQPSPYHSPHLKMCPIWHTHYPQKCHPPRHAHHERHYRRTPTRIPASTLLSRRAPPPKTPQWVCVDVVEVCFHFISASTSTSAATAAMSWLLVETPGGGVCQNFGCFNFQDQTLFWPYLRNGTKPLSEPVLTNHQRSLLAFTNHDIYPCYEFENYWLNITAASPRSLGGANKLMSHDWVHLFLSDATETQDASQQQPARGEPRGLGAGHKGTWWPRTNHFIIIITLLAQVGQQYRLCIVCWLIDGLAQGCSISVVFAMETQQSLICFPDIGRVPTALQNSGKINFSANSDNFQNPQAIWNFAKNSGNFIEVGQFSVKMVSLVQDCSISIANVLEITQSCTKPSTWFWFLIHLISSPSDVMPGTSVGSLPQSFPKFQHPSHELLKENGFVWCVYNKYRAKCIKGKRTFDSQLIVRTANMSWRTCVVIKQIQSNSSLKICQAYFLCRQVVSLFTNKKWTLVCGVKMIMWLVLSIK